MITMPPVVKKWSPNCSERSGRDISVIVVHDTEGGYEGAVYTFLNTHSQVSAHMVMKEDGSEVTLMVPLAKKAWAVCDDNSFTISLEMAGFAKNGYSEAEWETAANIVAWLLHYYKLPATWAQHGNGQGFCSHYDLGPHGGGHTDPTTDSKVWSGFVGRVQDAYAAMAAGLALPAWDVLDLSPAVPPTPITADTLLANYSEATIRWVQGKIGAPVDGIIGPTTRADLEAYQKSHGLVPDGIIGPKTLALMAN